MDEFVYAYLVETLVIQAFACEFREIFSSLIWNVLVREFLSLVFCLRCRATGGLSATGGLQPEAEAALTRLGAARARHGMARGAVTGGRRLTHIASLTNLGLHALVRAPERLLLTEEAEEALREELADAESVHAVAAARLRSLARSWRLQHLVGAERAEARLALEQGATAWARKRTWRLWQHVRALPSGEAGTAQLQQVVYTYICI